jgi:hypothetical protein
MGNRSIVGAACSAFICAVLAAPSGAVVINFDVDASGNPLLAPNGFAEQNPLRNEYASLGVTFSGPSALDGGAILDQFGNFGVNARSGRNFLAFNGESLTTLLNGGVPRDPETLTFSTPLSSISIWASGGAAPNTFRMDAFSSGGALVGSSTQSSTVGAYAQLSIANPSQPISRVVLTGIGGDPHFVYDDLEFTFVPEPAGVPVGAFVLAGMLRRRRQ